MTKHNRKNNVQIFFLKRYVTKITTGQKTKAKKNGHLTVVVRLLLETGRGPALATETSMQLDVKYRTICRLTSDSRTCHTAVSDCRLRHLYLVSGTKTQCEVHT